MSRNAQSANACWRNEQVIIWLVRLYEEIIHWLNLVDYLLVQTHQPYNNLQMSNGMKANPVLKQ